MMVRNILYHPEFVREFRRLEHHEQLRAIKIERMFRSNPLHPFVRLHQLKGKLPGLCCISVSLKVRIIFQRLENGDIVFVSIGRHDVYQ